MHQTSLMPRLLLEKCLGTKLASDRSMPYLLPRTRACLFQYNGVYGTMDYQKDGMARLCISGSTIEFDIMCDFTSLLPYLAHAV